MIDRVIPALAKSTLGLALVFALMTAPVQAQTAFTTEFLRVVSWGGVASRAIMLAMAHPWEKQNQKFVEMEIYNGGITEIKAQVDAASVRWDVVDFEYSDLIQACDAGLLEKMDHSQLPPGADGTAAKDDFIDGALTECGVGTYIWATVYTYEKSAFPGDKPTTIADFFDVKKYPGKRGLRKDPRGALEWALLADGVAPGQVYATLATPHGINLAFEILDEIRPNIVWWETGNEPLDLMADGSVSMTAAWNGRLYEPIISGKRDLEIVWDGQIWEIEFYGIPKGSRRLENAISFVHFATGTQALADSAGHNSYGPVRKSAGPLVPGEVKPYLPTSNMKNALRYDSKWWAANIDKIRARFDAWAAEGEGATEKARF